MVITIKELVIKIRRPTLSINMKVEKNPKQVSEDEISGNWVARTDDFMPHISSTLGKYLNTVWNPAKIWAAWTTSPARRARRNGSLYMANLNFCSKLETPLSIIFLKYSLSSSAISLGCSFSRRPSAFTICPYINKMLVSFNLLF